MDMQKRCYKCTETLNVSLFRKDSSRKDGLSNKCKACENKAKTERRKSNPASRTAQRVRMAAYQTKRLEEKRSFVRTLKESTPCADCGRHGPYYCMDYDHITETKNFEIGDALNNSRITLEALKAEIALCELVCAYCHRIRTHERGYRRRI